MNPGEKKPNILWICTDQQRFDTLGCYGNKFVSTPNLDRLAEEGVLFSNAISQSPVCSPSRGSFLTGRYPVTCRQRQNGADIPDSEVLVTKLLHDAGYRCGLSGKLHLRACNPSSGCTEMESRIDDGYDEFHWSHDTAPVWGLHNEYYAWLHDVHGTTYKTEAYEGCEHIRKGMPKDLHQTHWCADKAIDFIKENKGRPWLFSVNMYDPHHPFDPPYEMIERYLDILDDIPLPSYEEGELASKTVWQRQDHLGGYNGTSGYPFPEMSDRDHRLVRAAYWAMCDLIDIEVGRMLDALKETDQYDDTIVIFHSDHGEMLGDHGIYLKGPFFYECAIHVPLIISWPGHIGSGVVPGIVELMDLPETILELCSLPSYPAMQGKSLVPLFSDNEGKLHDSAYSEYMNAMPWHTSPKAFASMVRTERWKLVASHSDDGGELYDLCNDPDERVNLFHDPEYIDVRLEMTEKLLRRWSFTVDPLPERKSAW